MNGTGVFSTDVPIGLVYAYFFNGGILLTLGGLGHSVSMLFRRELRRAAYVALGLLFLPLVYFYSIAAIATIASKTEGSSSYPVYLVAMYGLVAAAGASLLYGVVARQRLTETSLATRARRSRG